MIWSIANGLLEVNLFASVFCTGQVQIKKNTVNQIKVYTWLKEHVILIIT